MVVPRPRPSSSASTLRSSSLSLRSRCSHSLPASSFAGTGTSLPTSVAERRSSTARLHLTSARRSWTVNRLFHPPVSFRTSAHRTWEEGRLEWLPLPWGPDVRNVLAAHNTLLARTEERSTGSPDTWTKVHPNLVKSLNYSDLGRSLNLPGSGRSVKAVRLRQVKRTVQDFEFILNNLHLPWPRHSHKKGLGGF